MISDIFHTTIYLPLYNALVYILSLGSWLDMGIAVIILTVFVRLLLAPFSLKAARTQHIMRGLTEDLALIKEKYKDDREKQGREMLDLYKRHKINPFSGILTLFIQIPVILGLYFVFLNGGLPEIETDLLYSFVHTPFFTIETHFLGMIDMLGKSIPLALLAGITQHIHTRYAFPLPEKKKEGSENSFQEDLMKSMRFQMLYILPIIVVFVGYIATASVALYWVVSNVFSLLQEWYVKKTLKKEGEKKEVYEK
jgi:YidC/Oxa1 family membrane protein insertase